MITPVRTSLEHDSTLGHGSALPTPVHSQTWNFSEASAHGLLLADQTEELVTAYMM